MYELGPHTNCSQFKLVLIRKMVVLPSCLIMELDVYDVVSVLVDYLDYTDIVEG